MNTKYYNKKGEHISKEEFDTIREQVIAQRIRAAENDEGLIDDEDLEGSVALIFR